MRAFHTYDYRNRLAAYRAGADSARYIYDAFDRPVEQTESHDNNASTRKTAFAYLGLSDQVSQEQQTNGATGAAITSKSYSFDADGERSGMTETPSGGASQRYSYAHDAHGNVSLLLQESGAAKASYGYTAYGDEDTTLTKGDSYKTGGPNGGINHNPTNPYRYSGKRLDTGSGTLDMGARRFGPSTARFLQLDRYTDAFDDLDLALDPLTQNRYALAGGNPISFVEVGACRPPGSTCCCSSRPTASAV